MASVYGVVPPVFLMALIAVSVDVAVICLLISQDRFAGLGRVFLGLLFFGHHVLLSLRGVSSCGCLGVLPADNLIGFALASMLIFCGVCGLMDGPAQAAQCRGAISKAWKPLLACLSLTMALHLMVPSQAGASEEKWYDLVVDQGAYFIFLNPKCAECGAMVRFLRESEVERQLIAVTSAQQDDMNAFFVRMGFRMNVRYVPKSVWLDFVPGSPPSLWMIDPEAVLVQVN